MERMISADVSRLQSQINREDSSEGNELLDALEKQGITPENQSIYSGKSKDGRMSLEIRNRCNQAVWI